MTPRPQREAHPVTTQRKETRMKNKGHVILIVIVILFIMAASRLVSC